MATEGLPVGLMVLDVVRKDDDPLVCPVMSTGVLVGVLPPSVHGGKDKLLTHALVVGCVGAHCAKWEPAAGAPRGGRCGL